MSNEKEIQREAQKRRTFGIISHPDAGKTTLTEKLLLYGGAIATAGAVKSRKASRHARSDWMKMEQERGISVTTSVMKFAYQDTWINLLDTPGHADFSEDTYRVLTAVDSAIMVVDTAKGVEQQTRKLMDVCRLRNTPVISFINKMDREGIDALTLLSEIEDSLGIECAPLSWPIGMGRDFQGTCVLADNTVRLFDPQTPGKTRVVPLSGIQETQPETLPAEQVRTLHEELDLVTGAGTSFDHARYLAGEQTPVFFGSALHDFGVQELLEWFVRCAPPPGPRPARQRLVHPEETQFSGVVFKIQANMDPRHRDRIAFLRINSGRFTRGMKVRHQRTGKEVQIKDATIFMAQDRQQVETAFPGDIIGIHNHGTIKIGDTFTEKETLQFTGIPAFAPEHFQRVRLDDPMKGKQLTKGLKQLAEEGAVQLFSPLVNTDALLGAVGLLQFDVIMHRLAAEYGVEASYEPVALYGARWVQGKTKNALEGFRKSYSSDLAVDGQGDLVFLARSQWALESTMERNPDVIFTTTREHT